MERFRKIAHATRVAIVLGILAATPAAAATYDGSWRVQIASQNAACGDGATIAIGIRNGQVASTNPQVAASGRVADAGNIRVTLASGLRRAVGFGHLTTTSGSGTWRGTMCSGTWTAHRI
jgi:hypothetical protein